MKIETIDVKAKEWFDKKNGNSYFSVQVTLNFGTDSAVYIDIPFQYGYGDHYIDTAGKALVGQKFIQLAKHEALWRYCEDRNIILRTGKQEGCLKRDL